MIGILLVTHSFLGNAFIQAVEQILGPQQNLKAVAINGDFDHQVKWGDFMECVGTLDQGNGVLVLTDLFGSAPSNLAIAGLGAGKVEVVVGINLPMLVAVLENRHRMTLDALAEFAQSAGQKDIKIASSLLESVSVEKSPVESKRID